MIINIKQFKTILIKCYGKIDAFRDPRFQIMFMKIDICSIKQGLH